MISSALREAASPIFHKVLFDEAVTLLCSRFLAFLMEPKANANHTNDLAQALELISSVFRAKGTVGALRRARELQLWAQQTRDGKSSTRAELYTKLASILGALGRCTYLAIALFRMVEEMISNQMHISRISMATWPRKRM